MKQEGLKRQRRNSSKDFTIDQKQYDDLVARKHETEFKTITYKRGLDTVEAQLVTYRKMRQVNTARPKEVVNAVKRNKFNTVKASACWVWMPKNKVIDHVSKNNSASVTLKRFDYIDAQGRFKWMHRLRGGRSSAKIKDNDERQRISRAEGLIQELLQRY
ncbi:hypothetical protein Tco_0778054 [Tanacetum coccineum]